MGKGGPDIQVKNIVTRQKPLPPELLSGRATTEVGRLWSPTVSGGEGTTEGLHPNFNTILRVPSQMAHSTTFYNYGHIHHACLFLVRRSTTHPRQEDTGALNESGTQPLFC